MRIKMKLYVWLLFALISYGQNVFAEQILSIKAAGFADKTLALFFEADYVPRAIGTGANLQVKRAKVVMFTQANKDAETDASNHDRCFEIQIEFWRLM